MAVERASTRLFLAPNAKPLKPSKSQTVSGSLPSRWEATLVSTDCRPADRTLLFRTAIHLSGMTESLSRGSSTGAASASGRARM